jgi:CHAD domain-containing protein
MVEEYREREDKFDVDLDWALPDLTVVLPAGAAVTQCALSLSSRYLDTAGLDLLRHGLTLRQRTGDGDVGWQLKVPDGAARTELRAPANANGRAVPRELRDVIFGVSGGAPLRPVATVDTARTVIRIVDSTDEVLVEIDDDHVSAVRSGVDAPSMQWREVEVELGRGDEQLLGAIGRRLVRTGALHASSPSKLAHVLGADAEPAPDRPTRVRTVGDLITKYLDAQYAALVAGDLALRRGQEVIHQTRVATRRYRSVLRVFADLFDPQLAATLDTELAWYAGLLGAVRDREVLRKHLDQSVASLPAQVTADPAAAQLDEYLAGQRDAARQTLSRQMRGKRYLALLATLKAWHQLPALTETAAAPARDVRNYLDGAGRTLSKRLRKAHRLDAPEEVLHRARKAGKRTRYTAELAAPVLGKAARREVKRATKLQDILGGHQDSVLASDVLLKLATEADDPSTAFAYGVLFAHEQRRRTATRERARTLRWT